MRPSRLLSILSTRNRTDEAIVLYLGGCPQNAILGKSLYSQHLIFFIRKMEMTILTLHKL